MKTAYIIAGLATVAAVGVGVYYMRARAAAAAAAAVNDVVENAGVPSQVRTDELTRALSPSARRVLVRTKQGTFSLPESFVRDRLGWSAAANQVSTAPTIF